MWISMPKAETTGKQTKGMLNSEKYLVMAWFLHLACELGSLSVTQLLWACVVSFHCTRLVGFQSIQSCKIGFEACAFSIRFNLHQICQMKTQHFTPMRTQLFNQ